MYYIKPLKSPTHIHFLTKNFYGFEAVFCIMILWFSPCFYAYYAERKFCHRYTHALSSVWNRPPYTHIICEKNFAPDIYNNCGAFGICERLIERWYLCVRFVSCFVYGVIVWIRPFLLIGRCQSLVIKAWWDCINSL